MAAMNESQPSSPRLSIDLIGSEEQWVVVRFEWTRQKWGWCAQITDQDGEPLYPIDSGELAAQLYVDFQDELNGALTLDSLDEEGDTTWLNGRPPVL
jgi:hypothetical protein